MSTANGWKDMNAADCKKRADHYDSTLLIGEVLMRCWVVAGEGHKSVYFSKTLPDVVVDELINRGFGVLNESTGHTISWL